MEELRNKARKYKADKNFNEALKIYNTLIGKDEISKLDKWLGWEYAYTLKNTGDLDKSIEVCKEIYSKNQDFKYIKDLLAWCLYEKYFRDNHEWDLLKLEEIAELIMKIVPQDENKTPYNKVVLRMVKFYKKPFDLKNLSRWIERVDSKLLSMEAKEFKIDGKEINIASPLEEWYYLYCKVLYFNKNYSKCLTYVEKAFKEIKEFHNNYDLWIKRIEGLCKKEIGRIDESIEIFSQIIEKRNVWICYYDLASIYIQLNDKKKAYLYLSKSLLMPGEEKSKVKAYESMGDLLFNNKRYKEAKMHYYYECNIREREGWSTSNETLKSINRLNYYYAEDVCTKTLKSDLIEIWRKEIVRNELGRREGIIINVGANKKYGFIKGDEENYYFNVKSVLGKRIINEGINVSYKLKDSFNIKKNKKSFEAIEIITMEEK